MKKYIFLGLAVFFMGCTPRCGNVHQYEHIEPQPTPPCECKDCSKVCYGPDIVYSNKNSCNCSNCNNDPYLRPDEYYNQDYINYEDY